MEVLSGIRFRRRSDEPGTRKTAPIMSVNACGHTRISLHYEGARVSSAASLSERTRDVCAGNGFRDQGREARPVSRPRRTTCAMRLEVKRCGNVHSELVAAVGWNGENEFTRAATTADRAMERQRRRGREGTPTRGVWSRASAVVQPSTPASARPRSDAVVGVSRSRRPTVADDVRRSVTPRARSARARRATRDADAPSPPARADPTRADSLLAFPDPARASVRPALLPQVCDPTRSSRRRSPAPADGRRRAAACAFAAACSDGTLRFFLRNGRAERTVEARGAVTSVRWTKDGACTPPARTAR